MWVVFQNRVPSRVVLIRVPYYIGDLKKDPNLESYPCEFPNPSIPNRLKSLAAAQKDQSLRAKLAGQSILG